VILASRTQRALLLALAALVVAIIAVLMSSSKGQSGSSTTTSASGFQGPTMPPGLRATDFTLTDQNGRRVSLSSYRGQVVMLTFIHSQCHDQCPFMVEQIKGALNDLSGKAASVPTLGVSVAPAEDTPASRKQFLRTHEMESRISFLNGPLPALRRVWHAYAIAPQRGTVSNHSAFVLLVDRRGFERVGFAADQLTPEGLAHDLRVLERESA